MQQRPLHRASQEAGQLGIVQEEFYAGRHSFALKKGDFTDLMQQAIILMDKDEKAHLTLFIAAIRNKGRVKRWERT